MIALTINLDGDRAWPDLADKELRVPVGNIQIAVLSGGMSSGRPSVAFRIDLPDGSVVIAETSARLFCTAAKAIEAKFPDLFQEG